MSLTRLNNRSLSGSLTSSQVPVTVIDDTNLPAGTPIQLVQHSSNATLSGTLGFANSPSATTGSILTSFNFTPKRSDTTIHIWSSVISIYESANVADVAFVQAEYNGTRICINYAPVNYGSFAGNLNAHWISIFGSIASWGTTQQTINIRCGMNSGSSVVNHDHVYSNQHGGTNGNNTLYFNMMEVKN